MILRQPLHQRGRHQQQLTTVNRHEISSHPGSVLNRSDSTDNPTASTVRSPRSGFAPAAACLCFHPDPSVRGVGSARLLLSLRCLCSRDRNGDGPVVPIEPHLRCGARSDSPNLERAAAAVRTIAFPVSPARGGRSPWRLSTRPLGTQPASRRTCPLAKSTAFIRTLAINGKQQLACRGGGFDDRVGSVPAAERRPRAAPNGTAPWLVRLSTGAR